MVAPPPEQLTEMPFLRNVGLIVTYQCQVTCPHCILQAGPARTERTRLEDALDWVGQLAAYRDHYVWVLSLTGGEPFYNLSVLHKLSEYGAQQGLLVSAVTNAFWATSLHRAVRVLESLPSIRMLQISADYYHQLSIPFERIKNAIQAARACMLPYTIAVCTENESDPAYQDTIARLSALVDPNLIYTAITFPVGRAAESCDSSHYSYSQEPPISACTAGSSPIIFPDGRVIACIGPVIDLDGSHPLLLGNLNRESLAEVFDRAQSNPVLHAIRLWGPRKLIEIIQQAGFGDLLPQRYYGNSVCSACYQLMANPEIVDFLSELARDFSYQRKIAYGRVYYLREPEMVELMGLQGV
jgi:hypothetical protein